MPKVGKRHFPYTEKGKKAAKAHAKKTGQSVGKYYGGGKVDPFSTKNPEGVPAEQVAEAMETQNEVNMGFPTANAMDRSQTSPDTEKYGKGGKVDITDIVKEAEKPSPIIGKNQVIRLMMAEGMSKEHIARFSKEYKSPKEEKIGKMVKKALKGKKK
jgi:hypothetical protein